MNDLNQELLSFLAASPSVFHTVATIRKSLDAAGFIRLKEGQRWDIQPGNAYYTVRNDSSIIAFRIPAELEDYHFQLAAAHGDSPTFKVKAEPELTGPGEYLRLNVEAYGGMLDYTWLDRPLSVAGRVLVWENGKLVSRLLHMDRDILLIPSVAIHMNRNANSGLSFNRQVDLCPLFSAGSLKKGGFDGMLADALGIPADDIIGKDLYLVNRQQGIVWGWKDEFVSAPKLDDLQAAFAALSGFLSADDSGSVSVYCCFDNEEVGSNTMQGAMSTFLPDTLRRLNRALGKSEDDYLAAVAKSFLVSFDNAHAVHPNHPEKTDAANCCYLNRGIVVKENAAQKYTTDAFSRAVFTEICRKAGVPVQLFANRSDSAGGSTLGNLSNTQVSLHAVDIGLPQLAMHAAYETAGSLDTDYAVRALRAYYETKITLDEAESAVLME